MRVAIYLALFLWAVYLALAKGAGPERRMAIWLLASLAAQFLSRFIVPAAFARIDYAMFFLDLATLAFAWHLSLIANRIWPLWIAATQLIAVAGHLFRLTEFELNTVVYATVTRFPAWVVCASLMIGTILHLRLARKYGTYPSWLAECPR
jgi:hypothetical protein